MKKYVIVTGCVCTMGGGQLYVLRRSLYLRNLGYDVLILVFLDNGVFPLKQQFEGFPIYLIPEMCYPSSMLPKRTFNKIIDRVIHLIGSADEYYFESHTLSTIEWAEILSNKCHGKHLAYPLAEAKVFGYKGYKFQPGLKIFYHKLFNNEFYGCSSLSLKMIFGKDCNPNNYVNVGFDESELLECCEPDLAYHKSGDEYVITTITRLDKMYVEPLIVSTVSLAKKYPYQKFVLLITGGSHTPGREDFLFSHFNNDSLKTPNLNLIYTGYIDKLGKDIFAVTDVFVGMGTAVINAISQRCVTINIDPTNEMKYASGIFGVDTSNFGYSENSKMFPILEKLEEAYNLSSEKICSIKEKGRTLFEDQFEINVCFAKLDKIINALGYSINKDIVRVSLIYRFVVRIYRIIKRINKNEVEMIRIN